MSMKHEDQADYAADEQMGSAVPSADYIQAISQFLETDPSDLLAELGYYDRPAFAEVSPLSE
jgi:hypothetical protein